MENTILMTQPKNPDKLSPEPRENYLTYSVNYTNIRAANMCLTTTTTG